MVQLEWVFLLQFVMGILLLMLLLRINGIRKEMDGIMIEVKKYVDFVTEEEGFIENSSYIEETDLEEKNKSQKIRKSNKKEKDEAENYLIQEVLKEYFQ